VLLETVLISPLEAVACTGYYATCATNKGGTYKVNDNYDQGHRAGVQQDDWEDVLRVSLDLAPPERASFHAVCSATPTTVTMNIMPQEGEMLY
jgi:hypothetical protein